MKFDQHNLSPANIAVVVVLILGMAWCSNRPSTPKRDKWAERARQGACAGAYVKMHVEEGLARPTNKETDQYCKKFLKENPDFEAPPKKRLSN